MHGPYGITMGLDRALWFTDSITGSIGRITTSGQITVYRHSGIKEPTSITLGPDGAVWFTCGAGVSIGRITTTGKITLYQQPGIQGPFGITAGPDKALWFTNVDLHYSIGRTVIHAKP
jgi:virginiamycin B lyase